MNHPPSTIGAGRRRPRVRTLAVVLAVAPLCLGAVACGGDDADESAAPASTGATAPGATEGAPAGDVDAFCQAEVAVEGAISAEDDDAIGTAIEALVAAAPDDIAPTVETVIAEFEASGGESPEFEAAYGEMLEYMKANCGFTDLTLTATEYAFDGIPEEVPEGPVILTLENNGAEVHEVAVMRVNDGVDETAEQLLGLPEEEAMAKATFAGAAFAFPGSSSYGVADLTAGRYIAVCFLPIGATPELMSQMEGPDSSLPAGAGPPHFTAGMVNEFEVA
ncbi:MAG: hypothetical protein GEV08_08320 [Acidimicrobiia bacterium]|nr:hypothetical protein [Acidimicrobiia bacterium]